MNRPVLTLIAGSNGSGKSTLTSKARYKFQESPLLDPDAISKSLQTALDEPGASSITAGKRVLLLAEDLIRKRQSFTVETTLSGLTYLKMATRAKESGFDLMVIFLGTDSIEINLERVRSRVAVGGHDVPEEDQRRRYPRTLANIKRLLPHTDLAIIFDNSTAKGHILIAFGRSGALHWREPIPGWAKNLRNSFRTTRESEKQ